MSESYSSKEEGHLLQDLTETIAAWHMDEADDCDIQAAYQATLTRIAHMGTYEGNNIELLGRAEAKASAYIFDLLNEPN